MARKVFTQTNEQDLNELIRDSKSVSVQTFVGGKYLPIEVSKGEAESLVYEILKDESAEIKSFTVQDDLYLG